MDPLYPPPPFLCPFPPRPAPASPPSFPSLAGIDSHVGQSVARRERAFARRYGVEVEARPNEAIDSRYPIMCALQAFRSNPCIGGFEGENGVGAHGVGVVSSVGLASSSTPYRLAKARSLRATLCPTLLSIPAREGNEGGEAGAGRDTGREGEGGRGGKFEIGR